MSDEVVGEISRHVPGEVGKSGYQKKRGKPKIAKVTVPRPLSPPERAVAEARAKGLRHREIAAELGVPLSAVHNLLQKSKVQARVKSLQEARTAEVEDLLRTGEVLAADFLNSVLVDDAISPELKFKAAESLLDRMGLRGRPVERKMEQSVQFSGNVDEAVARALADPGVQQWLQQGGLGQLKALPPAVGEEVIMGSKAPDV